MTRFLATRIGNKFVLLLVSVAGLLLEQSVSATGPKAPLAVNSGAMVRKVAGCAIDATGRPVNDALVLLTRADDRFESPPKPTVIAETRTQAAGRFELLVAAADFNTPAVGWPVFAIWVHKPGFGVTHSTVSPEHCERQYLIAMEAESVVSIRLETPGGAPCAKATVTPIGAEFFDGWSERLPEPIQNRLRTHTAANGRCELSGFGNRKFAVDFETAEFGTQRLVVSGQGTDVATVRLRPTHPLEGRLILPAGAKADLSHIRITLTVPDDRKASLSAGPAKHLAWADRFTVHPDADGRYNVAHVPEGAETSDVHFPPDLPFAGDTRRGFWSQWNLADRRLEWLAAIHFPGKRHSPDGPQRRIGFTFAGIGFWFVSNDWWLVKNLSELDGTILSAQTVWDDWVWLRKGVRITRIVRDADTKRPLPGVLVRIVVVPRDPEFQASFAKVRPLVRLLGLPLTALIAGGDFALEEWTAIMNPPSNFGGDWFTDAHGRVDCTLCPGETYATACGIPERYVRMQSGRWTLDEIPSGARNCELPPIDLVPECRFAGRCDDAAGQPVAGLRIRATVAADIASGPHATAAPQSAQPDAGPRWTQSDAKGNFHFDDFAPGTRLTLLAAHAGIPLEERTVIVGDAPWRLLCGAQGSSQSGEWRATYVLREKPQELTLLSGRVVGPDYKPVPGAEVVVEVEHSPDPTHFFKTTVDSAGCVRTPAQYPKSLKYRLAVRANLETVAASPWICPANNGNHFPDVVVEPASLGLNTRFFGSEVVALVDGRAILASEIFERAYPEPLGPNGLSLLVAAKGLESGRVTEAEYRELQILAIKKYAADYARTRMLARAFRAGLEHEERAAIDRRLDTMFEEYVEKLERDQKAPSRDQLEKKLNRQGTSLAGLKKEFCYRLLADEYIRRAGEAVKSRLDGRHCLAYYDSHFDAYAVPAKVTWQMIDIAFDEPSPPQSSGVQQTSADIFPDANAAKRAEASHPPEYKYAADPLDRESLWNNGIPVEKTDEKSKKADDAAEVTRFAASRPHLVSREQARRKAAEALAELKKGVAFETVAKKYSSDTHAGDGGWQPRIKPGSAADPKTADLLSQLPEGSTSGVIETEYAFRIVKVACRTPAASKTFEEVAPAIRRQIRQEAEYKAVEEVYSRTAIESPYIDELSRQERATPPCQNRHADAFSD